MRTALLQRMQCPYCRGRFDRTTTVVGDGDDIRYGLVECRCFSFPIVDGILLLSLAKGYGGAEEPLQPYVPIQVAAIKYLQRNDVDGLRDWLRRHAPFVAEFVHGTSASYLDAWQRVEDELNVEIRKLLDAYGRYEVLGYPGSPLLRAAARARAEVTRRLDRRTGDLPTPADYYASRFFSPRVNALALQLSTLPVDDVLSLCCGHGVLENLISRWPGAHMTMVDGQLLNLLITRHYADRSGGDYICHDLQYPLPFVDGSFGGVFSSTCLPEIPAQSTFAAEAIRVTSAAGWTLFDSIWNLESGVPRIDVTRHYRFCQNFFSSLDDYVPMFESCAGPGRDVGIDVPAAPGAYLGNPGWAFGEERDAALKNRADYEISVMVTGDAFAGFKSPDHSWINDRDLYVSPAFDVVASSARIEARRRSAFNELSPVFASRQFGGYPTAVDVDRGGDADYRMKLFVDAVVSIVPDAYFADGSDRRLPARS